MNQTGKTTLQNIQYKCFVAAKTGGRYAIPVAMLSLPGLAMAGAGTGGGAEFDTIWDTLEGWVQGTLGRIIALTMIVVGIVFGVAKQNIMAFVMGPAAGIGLFYSPTIIESIMGAGLAV
jgi:conjugal transfer pilus assembly protein TraA